MRRLSMTKNKLILALLTVLVFSADLLAVSMIETKREGGSDVMYVDGYRMLIKDLEQDARILMDLEKKKVLMFNPKNKTAVDMSEATWKVLKEGNKTEPPKVDARLEKLGAGPEIAGYATTHYAIYVDGHKCSEKWTSTEALKDSGFDIIWDGYGDFLRSSSVDADAHPCELAEFQTFRDDKYGMALKEVDHNCEITEVLRIERKADIDRSEFDTPADYKVVKMPTYSGSLPTIGGESAGDRWEGIDCSDERPEYGSGDDYMDDDYLDEEYADEEYLDEESADEAYAEEEASGGDFSVDDMAEEVTQDEVEDLQEQMKSKFKGFMNKFKKDDEGGDG
jgi:hypothetical protein